MKPTMLALVERSTGVLHAATIRPLASRRIGVAFGAVVVFTA